MRAIEVLSNVFSWVGGITMMASAWGGAVAFCVATNGVWIFLLAFIFSSFILTALLFRQNAVNTWTNLKRWGVLTLLFVSLPGGIFTLILSTHQY